LIGEHIITFGQTGRIQCLHSAYCASQSTNS
jgi:hypothetical protein